MVIIADGNLLVENIYVRYDMEILKIVLPIVLIILFILLVIWSIKLFSANMEKKRESVLSHDRNKRMKDLADENKTDMGYWYNKEDIEDAEYEDRIRYEHHFDTISECVTGLIVEMYDCGLVKTEEIYGIAYGRDSITEDSLIFRTIGLSDDDSSDDSDDDYDLPAISSGAAKEIYEKWSLYVERLLDMVEINVSDEDMQEIIDKLNEYGRNDLSVLLHSPE